MNSRLFAPRFGALLALLTLPACGSSESNGNPASGGTTATGGVATSTGGSTVSTSGGATTTSTGGAAGTTPTSTGGVTGGVAGGGGSAGVDPKLCPAQTAKATPAGTAGLQEAGKAVPTSATRPQLSQTQADALYTVLATFAHAGEITAPMTGAGGSGGGGTAGNAGMGGNEGAAGSGGSAGSAGTSGNAGAAGNAGASGSAGTAGNAGTSGTAGTAGSAGNAGTSGNAGSAGAAMAGTSGGGSAGTAGSAAGGGGAGGGRAAGPITYTINDDWDPVANGIGDVNEFVPGYTVAQDGSGTHTSIQAAINEAIYVAMCPRVYIRIKAGTYRETILVPNKTSAPPITIYSTESDASKTVIVNNNSAAGSPSGAMTAATISGSATFTQNLPQGFQAKNLTIANDYVEDMIAGPDQAAVALLNQGDKAQYENVRLLGNKYTLYVKSQANNQVSRTYFRDSYIEGDESFIAGRGTPVFDHCEIHSLGARKPTGGIIAAPSTDLTNPHGFLFISSQFTADTSATEVFLGHQWFEGNRQAAIGKVIVRNSTLGAHIRKADPWAAYPGRVTPKDPMPAMPPVLYTSDDYYPASQAQSPAEIFLGEYGNTGPGASP